MKDLNQATKIYRGGDHVCRCGCKGSYADRNMPKIFARRLKDMQALIAMGAEIDEEDNYINISLENNKALTAYFD